MPAMAAYMALLPKEQIAPKRFKRALEDVPRAIIIFCQFCVTPPLYMNLSLLVSHLVNTDEDVARVGFLFSPLD